MMKGHQKTTMYMLYRVLLVTRGVGIASHSLSKDDSMKL